MTKQYRIYTQRKNLKWMATMISEYFGGFTVYKTAGHWNAKAEKSVVIEIIIGDNQILAPRWILEIRKKIEAYNEQECVLITKSEVTVI